MPTPAAINICNKALRTFFGVKGAHLLKDNGDGKWGLVRSDNAYVTLNELNQPSLIWKLGFKEPLNEIASLHPFYFAINVVLQQNEQVESVNIKILIDDLTKKVDDLIPTKVLLRAEWDNKKPEPESPIHAQPHWHVHPYVNFELIHDLAPSVKRDIHDIIESELKYKQEKGILESMLEQQLDEEQLPGKVSKPKVKTPTHKLHLAMCAEWDLENPANKSLDNDKLEYWLLKCLNYIEEQLEYMLKKSTVE